MIYTSYFASRKYKPEDAVSIARFTPVWFKGLECKTLAPSFELLNWWKSRTPSEQSMESYQRSYTAKFILEVLYNLDVHKVAKELDGKVLLCYEKSEDFCHRHIIADWLRANGYECKEL